MVRPGGSRESHDSWSDFGWILKIEPKGGPGRLEAKLERERVKDDS